jgi:VWFA-related protein
MRIDGLTLRNAVVLLLVAAGALLVNAEAPQPRFRAGTDLVQVDVSVLDKRRHSVRGLTAADFTLLVDGKPREIQAFTEVNLPDRVTAQSAIWDRDVPSDVVTNRAVNEEGRIVIILLDRTIPAGQPTIIARRVAAAAVEQLGPGDLAAIVSTSGGATQNLTADRARLLRAINRGDVSTGFSPESAEIERDVAIGTGIVSWTPLNDGRCLCGLCVLDTVRRVAEAVQNTPRRRKVLFFIGSDLVLQSAGTPGKPNEDVGCEFRLRQSREAMFTALDRANLTVHSVDPSGLNVVGPIGRASSTIRGEIVRRDFARDTMENLQHQDALKVLPDRTGGRTVINTNAPNEHVAGIFRESDSYYLLGFRPSDDGTPTLHKIEVSVNRRGLDVHARSGYIAPTEVNPPASPATSNALSESVRSVLSTLLPHATVPLDVNVATFAVPGSRRGAVVLAVGLGDSADPKPGGSGAQLSSTRGQGGQHQTGAPFELMTVALDHSGRSMGTARQTLDLPRPAGEAGQERRVDILSRLDLPPGDYEIRVGATVGDTSQSASVFTYVTVPAFDSEPLSLSSIVIGALPATMTSPREFLVPLLPIVPTAQREFTSIGRITAFLRIYQGTSRRDPIQQVQLQGFLVDAKGQKISGESVVLTEAQFGNGRTNDHFFSLPIANLPPGDYLLRIEAAMGRRVAGRAVRFRLHDPAGRS